MMRLLRLSKVVILLFSLTFILTACDLFEEMAAEAPTSDVVTVPEQNIVQEPTASETSETLINYNGPEWATIQLTDARTGATFSLSDYAGKVVYVEPMATWCSNCRAQLRQVREAVSQLAGEDVVFVALSVENGLPDATLAEYADRNEFEWVFAVAPTDLIGALVDQFGRTVIVPPSTPHFIISPDGTLSDLRTGQHSANSIVSELRSMLNS